MGRDGENWTMSDSYIRRKGKKRMLSATQDKVGNTSFPISINLFGMRYPAAYMGRDRGN